jgi:hypothetical protein
MSNIIEKVLVDSECIHDAKYNNVSNRLTLFYKSGGVYSYENIPRFYWHGLFNANSKGKFINKNIIGKWKYNRIG